MTQPLGVVVGVDESAESGRVLDWAARQAVARGSLLTVCHVLRPATAPDLPLSPPAPGEPMDHGQLLVERASWRARQADRHLVVQTRVERGPVAVVLLRLAAAAEELVVGARGAGGFALLGLGSISTQLATHAPCAATFVRGSRSGSREVLVGVDGSACGQAALDYAFWFAAHHQLSVHALHAYSAGAPTAPFPVGLDAGAARTTAQELTADTVEPWTLKYPHVPVRRTVVAGHSGGSLVAASADAALLVVGSRGHGGFTGLLLGSVSHAVLRHGHCPITIAR